MLTHANTEVIMHVTLEIQIYVGSSQLSADSIVLINLDPYFVETS